MNIIITRNSVCAGDDIDAPHRKIIHSIEKKSLYNILDEIKEDYLPKNVVNGTNWIITQDQETLGIIEYPSNRMKLYKNIDYKITNNVTPLFAKCIGAIIIEQYETSQIKNTPYN